MPFLPIPPPHPSWTHLPPPPFHVYLYIVTIYILKIKYLEQYYVYSFPTSLLSILFARFTYNDKNAPLSLAHSFSLL